MKDKSVTFKSLVDLYETFRLETMIKPDHIFLNKDCPVEIRGQLKHDEPHLQGNKIKISKEKYLEKGQIVIVTDKNIIVITLKGQENH